MNKSEMKSIIHKSPAIYSTESCKKAINWFDENINIAKPGTAGNIILNNLELGINLEKLSGFFNLYSTILKVLEKFKEEYNLFDICVDAWKLDTTDIIMGKWEPNTYYTTTHCEVDSKITNRVFSWMLYLKDIKTGGGTEFIYQDITMKSNAGDFLIFPSGPSHMHRGENAPLETKYTITGHFLWESNYER